METKTYTKHELKEFIQSDFFNSLNNIPISSNRAISQINNPRADETDILLVAQYDGNILAGYIGALPEYVFTENKKEKCCWLTCFWVADEYKSKNVAANLFLRIIRAWEQKILITNIVPWLEPVYQKTKIFQPTMYRTGFRGYMRFNFAEILPPKKVFFEKAKVILKLTDFVLNSIHDVQLSLSPQARLRNISYEYLFRLGDIENNFISKFKDKTWNCRGKEEINWILSNPWIIEGAKEDKNSRRYYFSSVNKHFFYQTIKFTNAENEIVGIVIINIRERNLTVPFIFSNDNAYETISKLLISTMIYHRLNMITTYDKNLSVALQKSNAPFYFKKAIKKPYLITKEFPKVNTLKFQDGDGDAAFY